ncbi:hypothetical protein [Hymenobacter baengnokdamensis]|uniref:hypothetical protein n=1 Tax=Hymenobacter baengnokdamensis TaxID=2615203 RepID=UPI001246AAE2|nr:hypothetical protein [Hymenobacter baengnokdamensis]
MINVAKSQKYSLLSLKGDKIQFQLAKNAKKHVLYIAYSTDTIYVRDVEDVKKVSVINDKFLNIIYGVRAGTGITETRTLIVSGCNNKINQSLNITSLFSDNFLDFNNHVTSTMKVEVKSNYIVVFYLTGNDINNYKIVANLHDKRSSLHNPKANYNNHRITTLKFDRRLNIFYNSHEQISGYYTIWDPKIQKRIKQYIKGYFYVVHLGTYSYYYINNVWCMISDGFYINKYNYKSS